VTLTTVLIAVAVAVGLVAVLAARWLRQARTGAERAAHRLTEGRAPIVEDRAANCFGLRSAGAGQIRGNGYLGVTEREIVFVMWVPRREVHIPRPLLVEAGTTRSHLGKTVGRDLLHLRWIDADGEEDESAFAVRRLSPFLDELSI
jgi:hypothetical protein